MPRELPASVVFQDMGAALGGDGEELFRFAQGFADGVGETAGLGAVIEAMGAVDEGLPAFDVG